MVYTFQSDNLQIKIELSCLGKTQQPWNKKLNSLMNGSQISIQLLNFAMHSKFPDQIHTDNGAPFGSVAAIQRFTMLSYWFIELGILPVFSDPAHPEQNGRHERMHRDLKAECAMPSAFNLRAQQCKLNSFVNEYNNIRPHEALNMETPASVHEYSTKQFPDKIKNWDYPPHMEPQYVTLNGAIRWKSFYWVYMARGLAGKHIGMEEIGKGIWKVFYRGVFLGYFDETKLGMKNKSIRLSTNIV